MNDTASFLLTGVTFGLAAGLTPGPLQALICAQTLAHGPREGAKVAVAPLLTDFPVMVACLLALDAAAAHPWILGLVSLAGAGLVLRIGWGTMQARPVALGAPAGDPGSWKKGIATNALNPKMILFWAIVGSPMLLRAWNASPGAVAGYLLGFYLLLIGVNLALAWLSARFSRFLAGQGYVWTMRALGVALWLAAVQLAWDGLTRLGLA